MEIQIKWLNSNGRERYHILTQPHKLFPLANRGNINLWSSYTIVPNIGILRMQQRCLGSKYMKNKKPTIL